MKKFTKEQNGLKTEFGFVLSNELPKDIPISTPMTFAFVGQNLILVEKHNGWWDVPGGKIETGESWTDSLKRETEEEAGVLIDYISVVGYVIAKSSGNTSKSIFLKENILPVTISFVQTVSNEPLAKDVIQRQAFKRSEAKEVLDKREDNGQLSEIFDYVIEFYDSQKYEYEFEYVTEENHNLLNLPTTQVMVFVRTNDNNFFAVRDVDESFYSLPGGGCYMNETGIECAKREVIEEAQCGLDDLKLLGTVVVRVKDREKILSESKHLRYLARAKDITEFIPQKDDLEIVERKEVNLDFLYQNTKILKNNTGLKIIEDLKTKL